MHKRTGTDYSVTYLTWSNIAHPTDPHRTGAGLSEESRENHVAADEHEAEGGAEEVILHHFNGSQQRGFHQHQYHPHYQQIVQEALPGRVQVRHPVEYAAHVRVYHITLKQRRRFITISER